MSNYFDSAISHLTNRMNSRGEGGEREELRQAIRLLEAAGRVDKAISLEVHNRKPSVTTTKEQYTNACRQIRALLEALPDGGKK